MNAKDALAPALDSTPVVIHRQDYQPPDYRIHQVQLDFTLDLTATRVINEFDFERTAVLP